MKRSPDRRWRGAAIIAVLCAAALGIWQWQAIVRLVVVARIESAAQVRLSFGRADFGWNRATLDGVRITSRRDEPIAEIARLRIGYDPRDWLPGGKRLFGITSVDADAPHVTIVRRPDGSYNVPIPNLQANRPSPGRALLLSARVTNGSIDVINERPLAPAQQRHLFVRGLVAHANFAAAHARYAVTLHYGEREDRLYPVAGRGDDDAHDGYVNQRWTAKRLPIAGAVNFALDSASLRFLEGTLRDADLRYVGLREPDGTLLPHLSASARLDGGRIALAGLSKSVDDIRGPLDVYDDGLLTRRLDAVLAGTRVRIGGGIYGLRDPRLRVVVKGSGTAATLRTAIAQAHRIPIDGRLSFSLLVEGNPANPVTWIALRSPRLTYAATPIDRVSGLVALDGRGADVVRFNAGYGSVDVSARGRVGFAREPGAIQMLLGVAAPPGGVPYAGALLPAVPLRAAAVATADDPKAIAAQGALWGAGATHEIGGLFDVDSRGRGSIGPLRVRAGERSLYARVALDRPAGVTLGLLTARHFAIPAAHADLDGSVVGAQTSAGIEGGIAGRLTSAWGAADARGTVAFKGGALRGTLFGNAGREASFAATLAGTPRLPRLAGTVVVAGGRYKDFEVNGDAGVAYAQGALRLHDAALAVGPLFLGVAGTIDGLSARGAFAPRVDLAAHVRTSDVKTVLATVQPHAAKLVEGSLDADVRVTGRASAPSVSGIVSSPEGSVNGLAFRDLHGAVRGDLAAASVSDGRVVIGGTAVGFHGDRIGSRTNVAVDAPAADLADFNDYFDAGDTFAGNGRLAAQATLDGTRVVATTGDANLSNARYLRLDVGSVAAHWATKGSAVATTLSLGGPTGRLNVAGSVTPATMSVNLRADARAVDLATWLPMLGFNVPVTGRLDAQTTLAGRYPDVAMRLHAAVFGGTAGRLNVDRFEVTAAAAHGRGTVSSAILDVPGLSTTASGTFGLRESDPIALVAHSTSPDVATLLLHATGKKFAVAGALDSTLHLEGTRGAPRLRDAMTLSSVRYGNLTVPRFAATVEADRRALRVDNGEVDLERGKALLSAVVPIKLSGGKIALGGAPLSAALRAEDVELSNFAALLPKGTKTDGRIDGAVAAHGTLDSPRLDGQLQLRGGTFSGPMERTPIQNVVADVTFAGQRASLQSRAAAGGGTLAADGNATFGSLRKPAASAVSLHATASRAKLDMPDYFQGLLDADISVARAAFAAPSVSGSVSVSDARVPLNAFLNQKSGTNERPRLPDVAFNGLRISAGKNVRIQSRNVDIGATGEAALNGTLAAPTLAGTFRSTGGSLSFYRNFNIEKGTVRFDASSGVIPDVDAVATTFVSDPATAIRLHVTGPATDMNLALASDPEYSREQILGILVGAQQFGAVRGVRSSGQAFSAGSAATNVALGQLNTAFTRNMLEPLNASLAGTLGFSEVRITTDIQTGVGVSAVKAFGKNVNAIFGQTFGYPRTQSITLEAHPSVGTGLRLMAYTAEGPTVLGLAQQQPIGLDVMNLNPLTALTPTSGTNGFAFSYQRKFP